MKKILHAVIIPILVVGGLLFIAFGAKDIYRSVFGKGPQARDREVQEAFVKSQELKNFEESSTGITLYYPKTWAAQPIQNGTSFSTLGGALNVRVSIDDFSKEKDQITPLRYRELTKKQLASLEKEASIRYTARDEGTTTIAHLPAYQWTYSLDGKGISISGAQVWFVTAEKKVFIMTFTAPSQLFDMFYPIYQNMVSSIIVP